ncbi:MAG TPA: CHAT domain-containing protein, partial [Cyclobacteriaceae bacterium]|nr:CHAT domain-containing protein [Cyclobacteriaceae bacterium]
GDYPKCEYYLKKAKLYSRNLSFSTVSFKILRTKALLFWVQGHIEESSQTFNALIASYQEYIQKNFASMTEYERESFYALLRDDVDLFNAFAVETSRIENPQPRFEKMYNNQLFSKALLLNEINKLKDRIRNSTDKQLKNDFIEWENQKALLTSLYFAKKKNTYAINEAETRIEELEQRLNTQTLQTTSLPHQWKEIQSTLKDGEAAIEIIRTKKFALTGISKFEFSDSIVYAALIIDTQVQSPKLVLIENGNDLENKYLAYYRNSIISKQPDTLSYRQFWLPIQNKLGQYKKLYVSSDGVYNQVNLNILLNPATRHYLLDEIDVAFVTNTKDLLRKSQATTSKNSYLYARPEYRIDSVKKVQSITHGGEPKRSLISEDLENFREQEFEDLPGTEQEIKSLQKILLQHGWVVQANIGENASEANIKSSKNPGVLHIATHGFFLKENAQEKISSMIRSGIILAGVNNTDDQFEDGVLTASEATNLQLDSTYLVVLSACETGLGDVKNGEGVYGLQRGFIVAGTKYLLMSLWKIDDLATASLMENIYSEWLKSGDLPASVKEAQLLLRKDYPQPFYWGSFILLGN